MWALWSDDLRHLQGSPTPDFGFTLGRLHKQAKYIDMDRKQTHKTLTKFTNLQTKNASNCRVLARACRTTAAAAGGAVVTLTAVELRTRDAVAADASLTPGAASPAATGAAATTAGASTAAVVTVVTEPAASASARTVELSYAAATSARTVGLLYADAACGKTATWRPDDRRDESRDEPSAVDARESEASE